MNGLKNIPLFQAAVSDYAAPVNKQEMKNLSRAPGLRSLIGSLRKPEGTGWFVPIAAS